MTEKRYWLIVLIVLFLVFAWSPWMTKVKTERIVTEKYEALMVPASDGCGHIKQFISTRKIPFGFISTIEYSCGFRTRSIDEDKHLVYVSPFGNVFASFTLTGNINSVLNLIRKINN